MKKALLVLLLLAVAGGLFAQVTWGARVYAGYNATLNDGDTDWGLNWNSGAGAAVQGRLYGTFRNEAGTVGGSLQLRAAVSNGGSTVTAAVYYGWFTLFEGKLKVLGGKWGDGEFSEQYIWAATLLGNDKSGLALNFYPMDGLRLGFGLHSNTLNATTSTFDNLEYWFGAAYEAGDIGVFAQANVGKDLFDAQLDFVYDAEPITGVFHATFSNLADFSNSGEIGLNEFFGYYGVENLDLELYLSETLYGNGDPFGFSTEVDVTYNLDITGIPAIGIELEYGVTDEYFRLFPFVFIGQSTARNYLQLGYGAVINFDGTFDNNIRLRFFWRY
jgi:hypothetical protein